MRSKLTCAVMVLATLLAGHSHAITATKEYVDRQDAAVTNALSQAIANGLAAKADAVRYVVVTNSAVDIWTTGTVWRCSWAEESIDLLFRRFEPEPSYGFTNYIWRATSDTYDYLLGYTLDSELPSGWALTVWDMRNAENHDDSCDDPDMTGTSHLDFTLSHWGNFHLVRSFAPDFIVTNAVPVVYADALASATNATLYSAGELARQEVSSLSNSLSQAIADAQPADYANVSNRAYSAVQQIAPDFTAKAYSLDELCSYNGTLYRCKAEYTATAQSTKPDADTTHWETKKVSELFLPLTGGRMGGSSEIRFSTNYGLSSDVGGAITRYNAQGEHIGYIYLPNTNGDLALISDIPDTRGLAPLASPAFTGTPTAPDIGTNTVSQVATKEYVDRQDAAVSNSLSQAIADAAPADYANVSNLAYSAVQTESDPTIYSWAKASTKPGYTAAEVGAVPTSRTVNGKALSADISLSAADVGAATPTVVTNIVRDLSLGGIWDEELEVWWTPRMSGGSLTYHATTNVNMNAGN